MSVESDLKKEGIKVIKQLDTLKVNSIAKNVANSLCSTFPDFDLCENDLFSRLAKLNMYIAKMPVGSAKANYFYKNFSIYFSEDIPEKDIEKFAIHECIHRIQEVRDGKNFLLRMGLCDYSEFRIYGLGLNEAAVQLMTSKILGTPKEVVKYFGISFETNSPSYYPLECCLASQIAYIVGENTLFESTINANDSVKEKFTRLTSFNTFMTIQNNIDKILVAEEKISKISDKIMKIDDRNKKVDNLIEKINSLKKTIATTFINTQNLIISSYFDKELNKIETLEGIEEYRKKLCNFRDYLGATDKYTFFNDYYVDKMIALEDKYNLIESGVISPSVYLIEKNTSKFSIFLRYIRKLFIVNKLKNAETKNSL